MTEDNQNNYKRGFFKIPRVEQKKIRKEYETSKEAASQISAEKLKNFSELTNEVFDFFEELAGKKVHREVMVGNLHYYLDEGFDSPEMKIYIQKQFTLEFYRENPERFTIQNLFPIKDQDRINITWDFLAYFQGLFSKGKEILNDIKSRVKIEPQGCYHPTSLKEALEDPGCTECIKNGDEFTIIANPYKALKALPESEKDLRALAEWFCRDTVIDHTPMDYAKRTDFLRREIWRQRNRNIGDYIGLMDLGIKSS